MAFPAWFHTFCSPTADRYEVLCRALAESKVGFETLNLGGFRHLQVRGGRPAVPVAGEKVVLAHFDRVPGAGGANDNGAGVLALVDYLTRSDRRLRVIFTDGEELGPGGAAIQQGAYALARAWGGTKGLFPVVLDMCGIGDTFVLGRGAEELLRQANPRPNLGGEVDRLRWTARRWLAGCGAGDTVEVNTPFSDDLGLLLAGVPAVQVSLLPRKEALAYRQSGQLPPAWKPMHTADDIPDTLWPSSRDLVAQLLDRLEAFPDYPSAPRS